MNLLEEPVEAEPESEPEHELEPEPEPEPEPETQHGKITRQRERAMKRRQKAMDAIGFGTGDLVTTQKRPAESAEKRVKGIIGRLLTDIDSFVVVVAEAMSRLAAA